MNVSIDCSLQDCTGLSVLRKRPRQSHRLGPDSNYYCSCLALLLQFALFLLIKVCIRVFVSQSLDSRSFEMCPVAYSFQTFIKRGHSHTDTIEFDRQLPQSVLVFEKF